jgi:putative flippase GtrA
MSPARPSAPAPEGGEQQAASPDGRPVPASAIEAPAHQGRPLRYLVVGAINTAFAYLFGGLMFKLLHHWLATPLIGTLATLVTISFSFVTLRHWVFRSRAPWLREWLRCYGVYALSSAACIAVQWWLVDGLQLSIWYAQALIIPLGVALSYAGHARFTFAP